MSDERCVWKWGVSLWERVSKTVTIYPIRNLGHQWGETLWNFKVEILAYWRGSERIIWREVLAVGDVWALIVGAKVVWYLGEGLSARTGEGKLLFVSLWQRLDCACPDVGIGLDNRASPFNPQVFLSACSPPGTMCWAYNGKEKSSHELHGTDLLGQLYWKCNVCYISNLKFSYSQILEK